MLVHVWYEHYIVKSYKWNWMWESYVNTGVFSVIKLTVQYRKLLKIWFTLIWLRIVTFAHGWNFAWIIDIYVCYLYIFTYTQCVVLNDETWSFYGSKRYQSDFSHTDPACQLQQQWTKWWLDRFTLDFSDVREHEAWMIYEQ
jgi:hypothetical protein